MPFAKDSGSVAGGLQGLGENGGIERHALAFENGVSNAILEWMASGHERRARGRAGGADEKAGEAGALVVEFVEVWSLDPRVAVTTNRPVALVIGYDENDVWFVGGSEDAGDEKRENQKESSGHENILPE